MIKKQSKKRSKLPMLLTAKDLVYPFIVDYMRKNSGLAPTLAEVAKHFKRTPEWVRVCYKMLAKAKLIRVDYYKRRGVLLIGK